MATEDYGRLRLLFVDDAPHIRLLLREILRGTRWPNAEFADGAAAAFEAIKTSPPDLVITDWHMPGRSGVELIHDIRELPDSPDPLLAVIVLTANGDAAHVIGARDAGATGFLLKPISIARITEGIINVVTKEKPFIVSATYNGPERRGAGARVNDKRQDQVSDDPIRLPSDGLLLAKVQGDAAAYRAAMQRRAEAIAIVRRVGRAALLPAEPS
jgi:two-component system chemotaxis response regulator CheY